MPINDLAEKRASKRFPAQEGAFAVVNEERKLGQILDISHGGLSFKYIASGPDPVAGARLDIFFADHGYVSQKVPFVTVSDSEIESNIRFSFVSMRRCGVKFTDLNANQISQIDNFIQMQALLNE